MSERGEERCGYMVNTDVSITLYVAARLRVAHPLRAWFRRHRREVCFSELLRDELHDMERRGKLCPGDAQRILGTLRRHGAREEPARVGLLRRRAAALLVRAGLSLRLRNDAALALHASSVGARLVSYNERDYEMLERYIRGLVYVRPPGAPLAYSCGKGGQAGEGVQGRGRKGARQAGEAGQETRAGRRHDNRRDSGRALQAGRGRGRGQAKGAGEGGRKGKGKVAGEPGGAGGRGGIPIG